MDPIKKAMELARARRGQVPMAPAPRASIPVGAAPRAPRTPQPVKIPLSASALKLPAINLDLSYLESMRIVAHESSNPLSSSFDVLRTTVLQEMEAQNWQSILITSPSPGCGKTVSAINLAFSIARQEGRKVILADFDLRKPMVASYLGFKPAKGVEYAVTGKGALQECLTVVKAGGAELTVLANTGHVRNPAEVIASRQMKNLLNELKATGGNPIVVVDSSPMLVSDDVLALLPQIDCVILAVAEKITTIPEVETCERHLQASNYLGIILTKSHEKSDGYSYY